MKRILLSLALILATITVVSSQIRPTYKVEAGVNFSNMSMKEFYSNTKWMIGYRVGVGAEFDIASGFYTNPGIYLLSRGSKTSEDNSKKGTFVIDRTFTFHTLEIPLPIGYRMNLRRQMSLSMQVGPYLAYGLVGKGKAIARPKSLGNAPIPDAIRKEIDKFNNTPDTNSIDFYKEKDIKRFDWGIGMQTAFEYTNFNVHTGVEYGLMNVSGVDATSSINHMNFYVGVGYRF